jgi:hypothetical protein
MPIGKQMDDHPAAAPSENGNHGKYGFDLQPVVSQSVFLPIFRL